MLSLVDLWARPAAIAFAAILFALLAQVLLRPVMRRLSRFSTVLSTMVTAGERPMLFVMPLAALLVIWALAPADLPGIGSVQHATGVLAIAALTWLAASILEGVADGGCPEPVARPEPKPAAKLCLENPSFDGTPEPNLDQQFDAKPWSTCTNPAVTNTPDIGNDEIAQTPGVPKPTHGATFLGLAEGEQVSQAFCSPLPDGVSLSLELDLARINLNILAPETEQVFLELHGGLSVNCSQHELLWASPALRPGWQHFCVTLRPRSFMTQLTLRANTDMTSAAVAYLIVDNLKPVDSCP